MSKTNIYAHIHLNVDTVPQLLAALTVLEHRDVLVGVPQEKNQRKPDAAKKGQKPPKGRPLNNAEIARIQNDGSPRKNIPGMHFMEDGIKDANDGIEKGLMLTGQAALNSDPAGVEQGLDKVGLVAVNGIRNRIRNGDFPPLKPATLRARRRRGRTGTKRGQDTGQMRNAITYVKRKRS